MSTILLVARLSVIPSGAPGARSRRTHPCSPLGHGTATADQLAQLIRGAAIASVVDVRTVPKSRRHPQFWREEMERWIPELAGAAYRWEPALGGFRKSRPESPNVAPRHPAFRGYADYMQTDAFVHALDELLAQAARSQTAIL